MGGASADAPIARAQPKPTLGAFDGFLVCSSDCQDVTEGRISQRKAWVQVQCPAIRPLGFGRAAHSVECHTLRQVRPRVPLVESECGPRLLGRLSENRSKLGR